MKLERRELAFFGLGGLCLITLLYFMFIISPALSRQKSLAGFIEKKESDMLRMVALRGKWDRFKQSRAEAERILTRRGKKFTLLTFLESVSRAVDVHKNIQYIKPLSYPGESGPLKREGIEMKFDDINTKQLVEFLYKIEYSAKLLQIKLIKIKRKAKEKSLAVTLQINTYVSA